MPQSCIQGDIICVRGGGDLATGVIQKFVRAGMRVFVLETANPTAIRRFVSLSMAIYDGEAIVEDIRARRIDFASNEDLQKCWNDGFVPILIDEQAKCLQKIKPDCVVDAILAKRNFGTTHQLAPITIGLGPGFVSPDDVDIAIETMRGHDLGRLIFNGQPIADTGSPGEIAGESTQRVMRAPCEGTIAHHCEIGDWLEEREAVFSVSGHTVYAPFSGLIRGLIREGTVVFQNMKVADIDPRRLPMQACRTISDKARNLGGAALEAYLYCKHQNEYINRNNKGAVSG